MSRLALFAYVGADVFLEEEEDLQERENETVEELAARVDLLRAFQKLGDVSDDIEKELEPAPLSDFEKRRREKMKRTKAS